MALTRTCVGCSQRDTPAALLRFVVTPAANVVFDEHSVGASGQPASGRGAHVHARSSCLEVAAKRGFSRSFRRAVTIPLPRFGLTIVQTVQAQAERLLARAARHHRLVAFSEARTEVSSDESGLREDEWLLVACDGLAAAGETSQGVAAAVRQGRALAFGNRALFGTWMETIGEPPASYLILRDVQVASSVARACAVADGVRVGRVVEDG